MQQRLCPIRSYKKWRNAYQKTTIVKDKAVQEDCGAPHPTQPRRPLSSRRATSCERRSACARMARRQLPRCPTELNWRGRALNVGSSPADAIAVVPLRARKWLHRPERTLIKVPAEHREGRIAIVRRRHPGRPECANCGHSQTARRMRKIDPSEIADPARLTSEWKPS